MLDTLGWASLALALLLSIYAARSLIFIRAAGKVERKHSLTIRDSYPFVSVLIATRNEALVIGRLLGSLARLTYPKDRFEIIIVDDSDDGTFNIISSARIPNLKAARRDGGEGWKGGALNLALKMTDERSSYSLVLDADSVLAAADTIEQFVARFVEKSVVAVQGFPMSMANPEGRWQDSNWVARGIDFRLTQRNLIEFSAKDGLGLPVQITGSLFMARSDALKAIRFSNDLCEDWDLTLDIHTQPFAKPKVVFDPSLASYCEATTKLEAYFRQRMRVSEGHTRGFRKKAARIMKSKLAFAEKVELVLTGLQYAKFVPILALVALDAAVLAAGGLASNVVQISLAVQAGILASSLAANGMAARACKVRDYGAADVLSLLALNTVTMPAFVAGSLRGFVCSKGTFYRTQRNVVRTAVAE